MMGIRAVRARFVSRRDANPFGDRTAAVYDLQPDLLAVVKDSVANLGPGTILSINAFCDASVSFPSWRITERRNEKIIQCRRRIKST